MMETARLKSRRIPAASASELALPETDPMLDLPCFTGWRTKQMNVIGHDQITTNEPRIGFVPGSNQRIMHIRIRETLRPISGTNSEEDNRGLPTKNENAFRWIPASNIISHSGVGSTESRPTNQQQV
jgi:hypothetical protein